MRKLLLIPVLVNLTLAGSLACATKGFVRTQLDQVSGKVDTLSQSLEETQERTRRNEGRINDVDLKAQTAQGTAQSAQQSANAADARAAGAGAAAAAAAAKADALDKAAKRLVYTVVLSEDQGSFTFASTALPDAARARIDALISQLKADPKGAYFEIEGHTDSVGTESVNRAIGLARAEAVKRYLHDQHEIPLHRINVISYGEQKPIASNTTKEGRAQNRRVVIKVLN